MTWDHLRDVAHSVCGRRPAEVCYRRFSPTAMYLGEDLLSEVTAAVSSEAGNRYSCPRPCENHSAGHLRARLIQTGCSSRIKDSPRPRLRFYCYAQAKTPSVFTQPDPIAVIAQYERRRLRRIDPRSQVSVASSSPQFSNLRVGPQLPLHIVTAGPEDDASGAAGLELDETFA